MSKDTDTKPEHTFDEVYLNILKVVLRTNEPQGLALLKLGSFLTMRYATIDYRPDGGSLSVQQN